MTSGFRFCATEVAHCAERRAEVAMRGVLSAPAAGAVRALRLVGWARSLHSPPGGSVPPSRPPTEGDEEEDPSRPFPFSPSGANPFRWTVLHSLGKNQQRSGWKVLPFGCFFLVVVVWCYLRGENSADQWWRRVLVEEAPEPGDSAEEFGTPAPTGREVNRV
ncbi:protein CCSMST1 [Perognathus longimembris pacificus]|uniref:protein CCSMST1 n=1 Tax=Perognathus longimembris pacificus TaxID=214514 RepID=UPI0020184B64|nr:protein CCSMST1 [Perognathus longimembris pacificus]